MVILNTEHIKVCKCHKLKISEELRCTMEMIALCEAEDGVGCDGRGHTVTTALNPILDIRSRK